MHVLGTLTRSRLLLVPVLLAGVSASAFAQGSDNCASATPIAGLGTFPVVTTGATDSAQQSGGCPLAHADVWFLWTATASQSVDISLCGGTGNDTVMAVYAGSSCPASGSEIGCNDDSCGLESVVSFNAVAGATYLIQIGDYYAGVTYSGTFTIGASAPCGPNGGPDIIVGDLQDIANYAGQNVGGVDYDAVAFGTYSCNIGTVWANWISNTNQHPVIDNNLYKYKVVNGAGRFEQVGMSWLKHGFFALSSSLCCTGCQGTDGTHLGVHCADPYTAARNGGQSGAGPRWQVNAATGVFTYPPANPSFSGSVARRCRVAVSDLEVSSASVHYFGEAQYVTQDDAAAGNAYNNASYREVTVTGSGTAWTFALAGSTVRQSPAIAAWPTLDPGAQLANIDIPGDGRVVLGWKVTSLGAGQWHYEYALFNLNSDLSIGSFSVPVGAATISNIGFRDVDYHDGDGVGSVTRDGANWSSSLAGGTLTWSTGAYAGNTNGNGLMWGTQYNFRFDANQPPSSTSLTLGTWKNAGSVGVVAEAPGVPQAGPFCFGDGTGSVPCPCSNSGAAGRGCANSQNANGALLVATGTTSPDTLVLTSSGELPTAFSILLQGNVELVTPANFGDGLRCVGGNLKRLYVQAASGGTVSFPPAGGNSISAQSAALGDPLSSGAVRGYQVYYRDPSASFCANPPGNTWNVSNACRALW